MAALKVELEANDPGNMDEEDVLTTKEADYNPCDNLELRSLHTLNNLNLIFHVNPHWRRHFHTNPPPSSQKFLIIAGRPINLKSLATSKPLITPSDYQSTLKALVNIPNPDSCKLFSELLMNRFERRCRDQGCGQERDCQNQEETGTHQQQRYSLLGQELLYNSLPNKKNVNGGMLQSESLSSIQTILGVERIEDATPELILSVCKICSTSSKAILKILPELPCENLAKLKQLLQSDLMNSILQENTCYLVRYFIKEDINLSRRCNMMVFLRLEEMMNQQHTCRLVYTLCSTSASFREDLAVRFKKDFVKFIETLPGAILISHLVLSTPDLEQVKFIFEELIHNPEIVKSKYFGRAFATYMGRCSEENLTKIAGLLSKHISFLLQNNYGNYLLQIFFERKNKPGMELCRKALKKAHKKIFLRKYSRFVLLKAIVVDDTPASFCDEICELVCKDPGVIRSITIKRLPGDMLLLCISKVTNKQQSLEQVEMIRSCLWTESQNQNACLVQAEFRKELGLVRANLENILAMEKHLISMPEQVKIQSPEEASSVAKSLKEVGISPDNEKVGAVPPRWQR
jgi:hypothetical protein